MKGSVTAVTLSYNELKESRKLKAERKKPGYQNLTVTAMDLYSQALPHRRKERSGFIKIMFTTRQPVEVLMSKLSAFCF